MTAPHSDARRWARIVDWLHERMSDSEAASFAEELAGDPGLYTDTAWVAEMGRLGADVPLVEPPALLDQRLLREFDRFPDAEQPECSLVTESRASKLFDSRDGELATSLRGGGDEADGVSQVWRTERADIMLEMEPGQEGIAVTGQVLLKHDTRAPVFEAVVWCSGQRFSSPWGDAFGRFKIIAPSDHFELHLSNGDITLIIGTPLATS